MAPMTESLLQSVRRLEGEREAIVILEDLSRYGKLVAMNNYQDAFNDFEGSLNTKLVEKIFASRVFDFGFIEFPFYEVRKSYEEGSDNPSPEEVSLCLLGKIRLKRDSRQFEIFNGALFVDEDSDIIEIHFSGEGPRPDDKELMKDDHRIIICKYGMGDDGKDKAKDIDVYVKMESSFDIDTPQGSVIKQIGDMKI